VVVTCLLLEALRAMLVLNPVSFGWEAALQDMARSGRWNTVCLWV